MFNLNLFHLLLRCLFFVIMNLMNFISQRRPVWFSSQFFRNSFIFLWFASINVTNDFVRQNIFTDPGGEEIGSDQGQDQETKLFSLQPGSFLRRREYLELLSTGWPGVRPQGEEHIERHQESDVHHQGEVLVNIFSVRSPLKYSDQGCSFQVEQLPLQKQR